VLSDIIKQLNKLIQGFETGITNVANALPLLVRQEFAAQANKKLDSTRDAYMNALTIGYSSTVLVVELDRESWIANSVETGCSAFDMKQSHLQSQKAKMSQRGYKYMSIPLEQTKTGKRSGTEAGQALQDKIREALKRPNFTLSSVDSRKDGTVAVTEAIQTADPAVRGLYRVRQYGSMDSYKMGGRPKSSQFVLFRTMSENPDSKSKWEHPGIQPANIFADVQGWVDAVLPDVINKIMDESISRALES
jgi:hypothetical protein